MTDENNKLRAILLATLMVTSVFAGVIAFSGSAAADRGNLGDETSNKTVASGDVVFLGEDVEVEGGLVDNQTLTINGDSSETLDLTSPIPQDSDDQSTGIYTANGQDSIDDTTNPGVILRQPRITDSEIQKDDGDVTGATLGGNNADDLNITADFNYQQAEVVEVTVEDPSGTDITQEVLDDEVGDGDTFIENDTVDDGGPGVVGIDMADQDAGEYTIVLEGAGDLDFGSATTTMTLGISGDDSVNLELNSESATQGDDVQFSVNNGIDGQQHVVAIETSNIDGNVSAGEVFRNVGDTGDIQYANGTNARLGAGPDNDANPNNADIAYANLTIDGSTAVGSIETQFLDDGDVDLYVYDAGFTTDQNVTDIANNTASLSADDVTLSVEEGDITLSSPSGAYVVGSSVDVSGNASSADDVAVYVRDNNDWEHVEIDGQEVINVESDETFEEEDVTLSDGDGGGNGILTQTGTYRIGVIDAGDADVDNDNPGNEVDDVLSTSDFTSGTSSSGSIRVTDQALSGEFSTINGQVAPEDSGNTDVNGTALGQDTVAVIFVDNRGNIGFEQVSVDNDGTFDETDLQLDDVDGDDLTQGQITAHFLSIGRDGTWGDGDLPEVPSADNYNNLEEYINDLDEGNNDGQQVNELIAANTVEETASDDLIVTQTFRLAESSTSIDTVRAEGTGTSGINPVAVGETMVVSGTTNLDPDDNTINVEVTDSDGNSLALADTDEWNTDNGQYSVTVDTSDFETGTVTVEADDGDNTDVVNVEIVSERADIDTATPEPDTPEPDADTPEPDTDTPEPDTDTPEPDTATPEPETEEPTSTPTSTPGFGVVVALTALLAAALLAIRRD